MAASSETPGLVGSPRSQERQGKAPPSGSPGGTSLGGNKGLFSEPASLSGFVMTLLEKAPRTDRVPIGGLSVLPGVFELCSLFAQEIPC